MTSTLLTRAAGMAALGISALALTACGQHGRMVNGDLCANFKTTANQPAAAPADGATPVNECVRRWAYSLAGANDTADVVADGAVAACASTISQWNQTSLNQPSTGAEGVSLVTGQPSNPMAEHNTFARSRALLYVVQARAGQCAAPPVVNGAPAGTSPL